MLLQTIIGSESTAVAAWKDWNIAIDFSDIDYDSCCLVRLLCNVLKTRQISNPFLFTMKGIYRKYWYKNQLMYKHLEFILEKLATADIFPILFKGTVLFPKYYQDYGNRPIEEIELLILPEQYAKVICIITFLIWLNIIIFVLVILVQF